jgi:hypothetical protein
MQFTTTLNEEEEMKRNKLLAVAAAGVLTAATAVPALALENEFHGVFIGQYQVSNFNGSAWVDNNSTGQFLPAGHPKKQENANFFDSRGRLSWVAKANDNVKLVTLFEFDYTNWGNSSFASGRNQGGALGANGANFETKRAYLDLNMPNCPTNLKFGMQTVDDSFKGVFLSENAPGLMFTTPFGKNLETKAGFFRFFDSANSNGNGVGPVLGKAVMDFAMLDAKYSVDKNTKVGGAYYLINDARKNLGVASSTGPINGPAVSYHTLGVNAETVVGPLSLDGFLLYQFGDQLDTTAAKQDLSAFAANVGAKMKLGSGTLRSEFLYASGDSDPASGKVKSFQSVIGAYGVVPADGYYNGEMVLLFRDKYAMTIDNAIVMNQNNQNQGVIAGTLGYDMDFTSKLSGSANAGFAAVAKANGNAQQGNNKSDYLGTEINAEVTYKLYENVALNARAGYVFLGDYYKNVSTNGTPDNPYAVRVRAQYAF